MVKIRATSKLVLSRKIVCQYQVILEIHYQRYTIFPPMRKKNQLWQEVFPDMDHILFHVINIFDNIQSLKQFWLQITATNNEDTANFHRERKWMSCFHKVKKTNQFHVQNVIIMLHLLYIQSIGSSSGRCKEQCCK